MNDRNIERRQLERLGIAISGVRLCFVDRDFAGLRRIARATRLSASEIAAKLGETAVGDVQMPPPFAAAGDELLRISDTPERWRVRFPLWNNGKPTDTFVVMTVDVLDNGLTEVAIEDLTRIPGFEPDPRSVPQEELVAYGEELRRRTKDGLVRRLASMEKRRSTPPPADVPGEVAAAVSRVNQKLVAGAFEELDYLPPTTGSDIARVMDEHRNRDLKVYRDLLGVDVGPWAMPPFGVPTTIEWDDFEGRWQAEFQMWTEKLETDLWISLELIRQPDGSFKPLVADAKVN